MKNIARWLTAQSARINDLPRLEDALLGMSGRRYAVYRLRYVFVRSLLRTALRLLEVALFASAVPFELLSTLLVTRSCMMVTEGLWWGALEPLRNDVGRFGSAGQTARASAAIRQWLLLAVALGVAGLVAASLWVALGPSPYRSFSVVDVYVLGSAARWAIDLWATAYHSGVYGMRRVYRPLWSLALTDVADVAILGIAFWWLGAWGLGLSLVLVGVLRGALTWSFTRRVYRSLKFDLGGPRAWRASWSKAVWQPGVSATFALGNIVGEVDALLVVGLLAAPGNPKGALLLAALFHVLAPIQSSAASWPRLFYFDFKRLQAWGSPLLLARFEGFLERVAWWVPLPLGLVSLAILALFWRGEYGWLAFELLCLAAVRSRLALVHVRAYSLGDHRYLLRLSSAMLAVAASAPFVATLPPRVALGLVVALAAVGLVTVGRSQRPLESRPPRGLLGTSIWLDCLLREAGPLHVGLARVDRRLTTIGRVARAWRELLPGAAIARLSHDTLVWFAHAAVERKALFVASSGALHELHVGAPHTDGRTAFEVGLPCSGWHEHLRPVKLTTSSEPASLSTLTSFERELASVHPHLTVTPLTSTAALPEFEPTAKRQLRQLLLDAARGRSELKTFGDVDVAVLAPSGAPLALLMAPVAKRPTQPAWRSELLRLIARSEIAMTTSRATQAISEQR